ncbi:MAG TPA: hypothetical protein VMH88_07780 [Gemmatimonadales bacterium]|nr:hypothetical protein [Gemmatimonadales bacterium]
MPEAKTKPTKTSLATYLKAIADPQRRRDTRALAGLMSRASGARPVLWGPSIVGFGSRDYPAAGGKTVSSPVLAFALRAKGFVLYLRLGSGAHRNLLRDLGVCKVSGGCLHIRQLSDVDLPTLGRLLIQSAKRLS